MVVWAFEPPPGADRNPAIRMLQSVPCFGLFADKLRRRGRDVGSSENLTGLNAKGPPDRATPEPVANAASVSGQSIDGQNAPMASAILQRPQQTILARLEHERSLAEGFGGHQAHIIFVLRP